MISTMVSRGLLLGFSVGSMNVGALNISHLLLVHDILILCGVNLNHLGNLLCLSLCFEMVSGLRINLAKLELVPIGNVNSVEGLASTFSFSIVFTYEISRISLRVSF